MKLHQLIRVGAFALVVGASFYCPATIDNGIETRDAAAQGDCSCFSTRVFSGTLESRQTDTITLEGFSLDAPPHLTLLVKGLLGTSGWIKGEGNLRLEIDAASGQASIFNARSETLEYRLVVSSW